MALVALPASSQIIVPYANYSDTAAYSYLTGEIDSLYFFTPENDSCFVIVDTLTYKGYQVQWEEFVPGVGYQTVTADIKIIANPGPEGKGYQLTLSSPSDTVIDRCWLISYDFDCRILTKDAFDTLLTTAYTSICTVYGPIKVSVPADTVTYYSPLSPDTLVYPFKYTSAWFKEIDVEEGNVIYNGKLGEYDKYIIENAYYEDMKYWITVTDKVGLQRTDTVNVRSITPKADFEFEHILLDDKTYYPDKDTNYYFFYGSSEEANMYDAVSAPAMYFFKNKSKNAHEYLWKFGDSTFYRTTSDSVLKIYEYWGTFDVNLTAIHIVEWSGTRCESYYSPEGTEDVEIDAPEISAPNAFLVSSPDYPAWRFYDVSVTNFEIAIFSRYGLRVHHFEGNIRDWNGWDGRINNSQNFVSSGVYFYVVKTIGDIHNFDESIKNEGRWKTKGTPPNIDPPPTEYRGFIHVFNNN